MTNNEFSNEFDTLLNSYSVSPPFGEEFSSPVVLDEYEKSVFLTQAQEDLVISLYSGKNEYLESFESTEKLRRSLDGLIKTVTISQKEENNIGLSDFSVFFNLPDDTWFITYEAVKIKDEDAGCHSGDTINVYPVTQDEYEKIRRNPFKRSNTLRALRLDIGDNKVEIISRYNVESYLLRYLSRPSPIILVDLPDGLSINNVTTKTECKLSSVVHRGILERAVRLALLSKNITKESK